MEQYSDIAKQVIAVSKPAYGSPCNGCGWCCQMEQCHLSREILGISEGPCKALEVEGGRTYCGIVRRPAFYMFGEDVPASETGDISVMFAAALGLGHGCDADDPETHPQ